MSESEIQKLTEKIVQGISLSNDRLLEQKKRENGVLVIEDDCGNIVHVRAREIE